MTINRDIADYLSFFNLPNVAIGGLSANGSYGTNGQGLYTNGTSVYWANVITSVPSTYVQNTDSRTLSGNLTFTGLTTFSNTVLGGVSANGSYGIAGQALLTNGTSTYWGNVAGGTATKAYSRTVASSGQNVFTVSGGYQSGLIDVYYNGVHMSNTDFSEVNSTAIQLAGINAVSGAIVELIGWRSANVSSNAVTKVYTRTTATAGQNTFTTTSAYTSGYIDIYRNGIHLANNDYTEVNTTAFSLTANAANGDIIESVAWAITSVGIAGSNTWIQFNDSLAPGASNNFYYNKTTSTMTLSNTEYNTSVFPGYNPSFGPRNSIRAHQPELGQDVTLWEANNTIASIAANAITSSSQLQVVNNDIVQFNTTGTFPTGISGNTNYWVLNTSGNTFQISTTRGGSAATISGAGTGTHTFYRTMRASVIGDYTVANSFTLTIPAGSVLAVL